jgi:hypothetical protein
MKRALAFLLLTLVAACGARVKPISLHDQSIPVDSRRFVADTQDAVSIARASRDSASRELTEVRQWRREVVKGVAWPDKASGAIERLETLADNRVALAEMELDKADLALELAEAKYDLVTAETAIRHDIARYDLDPLRARTDAARGEMKSLTEAIIIKRDEIDELTSAWWKAYSSWAKKGDTRLYYVPFIDVAASKAPAKKKKKKAPKKKKKKGDEETKDAKAPPKDKKGAKEEKSDDLRIW